MANRRHTETEGWVKLNAKDLQTYNTKLDAIKASIDHDNFQMLVVRHWYYKAATAPTVEGVTCLEELENILSHVRAGDILEFHLIYNIDYELEILVKDDQDMVPARGSY